jgi:hypothetical protein
VEDNEEFARDAKGSSGIIKRTRKLIEAYL